jgi:CRISPR associated protein Cas1
VRNYYITRSGRLARQDNTLYLETETEDDKPTKTPIPIEDVDALYLYGEIDLNTRLLNFLAQKNVTAHVLITMGTTPAPTTPGSISIVVTCSSNKSPTISRRKSAWSLHVNSSRPQHTVFSGMWPTTRIVASRWPSGPRRLLDRPL